MYNIANERSIDIGKNEAWVFEKEYANAVVEECIKVINDPKSELKLRDHFSDEVNKNQNFKIEYSILGNNAATLDVDDIGYSKISGWTIVAEIQEDYYKWVNYFEATHPEYGFVKGDFEVSIEAKTKQAFNHFMKHYTVHIWNYGDI